MSSSSVHRANKVWASGSLNVDVESVVVNSGAVDDGPAGTAELTRGRACYVVGGEINVVLSAMLGEK